jgi:hypothetical protein
MNNFIEGIINVCCHRVSYWFGGDHEISATLKKEMIGHAEERAKTCIVNDCHEGELNFIDTQTEHEYTGWWRIETK